MKFKLIIFLLLASILLSCSIGLQAQTGVPQAMKFQAIARDKFGFELKGKKVEVQFILWSKKLSTANIIYYVETQEAVTSDIGLFTLNIGEGKPSKGNFKSIPWGTDDIYMDVNLRTDPGLPYVAVSSSRLLAVPYSFYSGTAAHVADVADGFLSNIWSKKGNWNTNPETDFLGTRDSMSLVFKTNDAERLKISANGEIKIKGKLEVGDDFTANNNVYLNAVGGNTFIDGITTLKNSKQSNSVSDGALVVTGGTGIGKNLNVGGNTKTYGLNEFNSDLESNTISDGALVLKGGAGIAKNLNIGGIGKVWNATESADITNGALVVNGGAGIAKNLNIGGIGKVWNATESADINSGALVVNGGAGIAKNLNIGGGLTVEASKGYVAKFINKADSNGISIQVGNNVPANANHFISFLNSNGTIVGRVEGETLDELKTNPDYENEIKKADYDIAIGGLDVALSAVDVGFAVADVAAAASSTTPCVGLGICETLPIASEIIGASIKLGLAIAGQVAADLNLVKALENKDYYIKTATTNIGVTYQSGAGDYAEWIPKMDQLENFKAGYIVAIKEGKVTLNTSGAGRLFVISTNPVVLGNAKFGENNTQMEKVAFMGQVPVKVIGRVRLGDYILASGYNNGLGRAVSPNKISLDDYGAVVGVAWSAADNPGLNTVNVAIGLFSTDLIAVLKTQGKMIAELEKQINQINAKLNGGNAVTGQQSPSKAVKLGLETNKTPLSIESLKQIEGMGLEYYSRVFRKDGRISYYYKLTDSKIDEIWKKTEEVASSSPEFDTTRSFWKLYDENEKFRSEVKLKFRIKIEEGLDTAIKTNSNN